MSRLYLLANIIFFSLFSVQANAGAAYCRILDYPVPISLFSVEHGSGWDVANNIRFDDIFSSDPSGTMCWSSGSLYNGIYVIIATAESVVEIENRGWVSDFVAGFGINLQEALEDAIFSLEQNAFLWHWDERDGYVILDQGDF